MIIMNGRISGEAMLQGVDSELENRHIYIHMRGGDHRRSLAQDRRQSGDREPKREPKTPSQATGDRRARDTTLTHGGRAKESRLVRQPNQPNMHMHTTEKQENNNNNKSHTPLTRKAIYSRALDKAATSASKEEVQSGRKIALAATGKVSCWEATNAHQAAAPK